MFTEPMISTTRQDRMQALHAVAKAVREKEPSLKVYAMEVTDVPQKRQVGWTVCLLSKKGVEQFQGKDGAFHPIAELDPGRYSIALAAVNTTEAAQE